MEGDYIIDWVRKEIKYASFCTYLFGHFQQEDSLLCAVSHPSHVAKPSLFFQIPHYSLLQVHPPFYLSLSFSFSPFQLDSQSLLQKKELVFHPYSSSGLIQRLVNMFVISGTVTLGPSFERHRGISLALHFVLPVSQPPPSLLGEAWINDLFPSVIMNDSTTHRRQKLP